MGATHRRAVHREPPGGGPALLRTPLPASALVAGSLAPDVTVGAAVHVLVDELTHAGRWGTQNLPALASTWGPLPGHRWLDDAGSVLGGAVVLSWLARWWRRTPAGPAPARPRWWLPWLGISLAGRDRRGSGADRRRPG